MGPKHTSLWMRPKVRIHITSGGQKIYSQDASITKLEEFGMYGTRTAFTKEKPKKKRSIHLRTPLNKVEGDYAFIA